MNNTNNEKKESFFLVVYVFASLMTEKTLWLILTSLHEEATTVW